MKLAEIISDCEIINTRGDLSLDVKEIKYDSRNVESGDMFIAIEGFQTDGHNFIASAIENGASVVVMMPDKVDVSLIREDIVVIVTPDTRRFMAIAACNFYNHPSRDFKLVGITGTKGKTTTSYMIKAILEKGGRKVGLIGTIANMIGDQELPSSRTTPESVDLQHLFKQMSDAGCDVVVMEVSSHALALDRVYGCGFDMAVFTNLSEDHLDFHKTFDNYLEAKAKLFTMAKEGFVNVDDMYAKRLMDLATCPITTYGCDNNPFVSARDIVITNTCADFKVSMNRTLQRIKVPIPGRFTVYNALAAICVTAKLGASIEDMVLGLESVSVPGRNELVPNTREFVIMVDYAHSPASLEGILRAVKTYTRGRVILVFGCGGDRDPFKSPIMGEIAGKLADITYITTDNPRTEDPAEIIRQIEEGMKKTKGEYKLVQNRKKAIEQAIRRARRNDLVLIAGKGHETYQEVNGIKLHFDDREVAREALKHLPEAKPKNY